jgi:hypothetical protein
MEDEEARVNRILNTILTENDRRIFEMIKSHDCTKTDLKKRTSFPSSMI